MMQRMLFGLGGARLFVLGSIAGHWTPSASVVLRAAGTCASLPDEAALKRFPEDAPGALAPPLGGTVGGLFGGTRMWGAVVNRDGELCAAATTQSDPAQVWPGSEAIAKGRAYTANAFSLDTFVLSTARLYTFTQPGHSLWSLGQSNLFESKFLAPPSGQRGGNGQITGGLISSEAESRCT